MAGRRCRASRPASPPQRRRGRACSQRLRQHRLDTWHAHASADGLDRRDGAVLGGKRGEEVVEKGTHAGERRSAQLDSSSRVAVRARRCQDQALGGRACLLHRGEQLAQLLDGHGKPQSTAAGGCDPLAILLLDLGGEVVEERLVKQLRAQESI